MKAASTLLTAALLLVSNTAEAQQQQESSGGGGSSGSASSPLEMVVTAHKLATETGRRILAAGGTAADAAVAVQTVLGLVEPQSSGIGGGAFAVYYENGGNGGGSRGKLTTFDARETAPAGATEGRFMVVVENGTTTASLDFFDAWQSGLSVGVPGVPRMMEELHSRYGKLPWKALFDDAIDLATNGYELTNRTSDLVRRLLALNPSCEERLFFRDPAAFEYFVDSGVDGGSGGCEARPAGTVMTNPDYAATLAALAASSNGSSASTFYEGEIARDVVAKVAADRNPTGDAVIALDDMGGYRVVEREPVCVPYRGQYDVCGMGPPSSGGLAVGQILGILDAFNLTTSSSRGDGGGGDGLLDVETVHLFTQAMRLAFADRDLYVGDTDFVAVPAEGMLNAAYLLERAGTITGSDMGTAVPGIPPGAADDARAPQALSFEGGTSHLSIVDRYGNAVSMTTSVEGPFGSGLMVRGFLLNNQLTDFSFEAADKEGVPVANRVQPNKRPRSSMSPTIVFRRDVGEGDGGQEVAYLAGSPGGSRIIGYTAQALVAMLDFGLDPGEAVAVPHYQNRNADTELEIPIPGVTAPNYDIDRLSEALVARNHTVVESEMLTSGLALIQVTGEGLLLGGADPRRDGTAGARAGEQGGSSAPSSGPPTPTSSAAVVVVHDPVHRLIGVMSMLTWLL